MSEIDRNIKEIRAGRVEKEQIDYLKELYISKILKCENKIAVQSSVSYASFLNGWKLDSENYLLFLEALSVQNKWVIDSLVENYDLKIFLDAVIPNYNIVDNFVNTFKNHKKKGMYRKTQIIMLGYLEKIYRSPKEGYALFNLSISDLNNIAKHLDENKGEDDEVNSLILDILGYINKLGETIKDGEIYRVAKQAGKIISDFFDEERGLIKSLTKVLLEEAETRAEDISPDYLYK